MDFIVLFIVLVLLLKTMPINSLCYLIKGIKNVGKKQSSKYEGNNLKKGKRVKGVSLNIFRLYAVDTVRYQKCFRVFLFPLARVLYPGIYFISHPPTPIFCFCLYFLFFYASSMRQVPAAATVATAPDTGPRTAESRCLPPQTGAPSIIQAVPKLLDLEQEVLPTEAQSDRGDDVLFLQLSEEKTLHSLKNLVGPFYHKSG